MAESSNEYRETSIEYQASNSAVLAHWHLQMRNTGDASRNTRLVLGFVTALAGLWTAGIVVAPWLIAHDVIAGHWLRWFYRPACHQISDRCLDLGVGPMAVCARCAGLYLGGTLALLWTTIRDRSCRPRPRWLAVVAAPTILDFVAGQIGLPSFGNWARFAIAMPLGFLAGLYLGDALFEIVRHNSSQGNRKKEPKDSVG